MPQYVLVVDEYSNQHMTTRRETHTHTNNSQHTAERRSNTRVLLSRESSGLLVSCSLHGPLQLRERAVDLIKLLEDVVVAALLGGLKALSDGLHAMRLVVLLRLGRRDRVELRDRRLRLVDGHRAPRGGGGGG